MDELIASVGLSFCYNRRHTKCFIYDIKALARAGQWECHIGQEAIYSYNACFNLTIRYFMLKLAGFTGYWSSCYFELHVTVTTYAHCTCHYTQETVYIESHGVVLRTMLMKSNDARLKTKG